MLPDRAGLNEYVCISSGGGFGGAGNGGGDNCRAAGDLRLDDASFRLLERERVFDLRRRLLSFFLDLERLGADGSAAFARGFAGSPSGSTGTSAAFAGSPSRSTSTSSNSSSFFSALFVSTRPLFSPGGPGRGFSLGFTCLGICLPFWEPEGAAAAP